MDKTITSPIGHREARRVSQAALIWRSGLLAIATGASVALSPFVHPENPQSAAWVPVHLVYFATLKVRTGKA